MRQHALDEFIMNRRPIFCKECGGKLFYQNSGEYVCEECGSSELDDFGKVKRYLDENGPTPPPIIEEETGVPLEILNVFLRNGRLEIPEGSKYYIKCERCGCALRFGRFCYDCTKNFAGQLSGTIYQQMGERPKIVPKKEGGKMRYLNDSGNK